MSVKAICVKGGPVINHLYGDTATEGPCLATVPVSVMMLPKAPHDPHSFMHGRCEASSIISCEPPDINGRVYPITFPRSIIETGKALQGAPGVATLQPAVKLSAIIPSCLSAAALLIP